MFFYKTIKNLKEDILCILERDPAARHAFEIITTYPGFHAVLWHRLSHKLWKLKLKWLARVFSAFARWVTGIEIHPAAAIGRRVFIDHGMGVVIGETAVIGNDCTLYHGVTLGGVRLVAGKRHPTLGDQVVVGAGAKLLGPIRVGQGARIGSNAVVTKDVPAFTTVMGIPGKVIGKPSLTPTFLPYGESDRLSDPFSETLAEILNRLEKQAADIRLLTEKYGKAE